MAGLLHAPLLMLTTLMVALNLSLSPMLVHTLQNGKENFFFLFSEQKFWVPKALNYAISKYNENSDDLYLNEQQFFFLDVQDKAAGTKYLFSVLLGPTTCLKSQSSFEFCPLQSPHPKKYCYFDVYVDKLENQMTLTRSKCKRIPFQCHGLAQGSHSDRVGTGRRTGDFRIWQRNDRQTILNVF